MNSQLSVTPTTKRPLLRLETVLILPWRRSTSIRSS